MSEPKEISATMLDAVTSVILEARGFTKTARAVSNAGSFGKILHLTSVKESRAYAEAALKAARVPEMLARIAELEAALYEAEHIAAARTCVGLDLVSEANEQSDRIAELEAQIATIRGTVEAHSVRLESCDRDGQEFCDCLERAMKSAGGE